MYILRQGSLLKIQLNPEAQESKPGISTSQSTEDRVYNPRAEYQDPGMCCRATTNLHSLCSTTIIVSTSNWIELAQRRRSNAVLITITRARMTAPSLYGKPPTNFFHPESHRRCYFYCADPLKADVFMFASVLRLAFFFP